MLEVCRCRDHAEAEAVRGRDTTSGQTSGPAPIVGFPGRTTGDWRKFQIAREILEEVNAVDAAEDEQFGQARGDELPAELANVSWVKSMRGWIKGYNGQAVTNNQQIIVAAEVMTASPDSGHLQPILDAAQHELQAAGVDDLSQVMLADGGYWHQQQMDTIISRGVQVLIPPDSSRNKPRRPGCDGGAYSFMRRVLSTEHGGALYAQRQQLIEPIFGNANHTVASTASADAAEPPPEPNGASSPPPTTSSSSTGTGPPPPDGDGRAGLPTSRRAAAPRPFRDSLA